eukprot:gene9988-2307_t
MNMLIEANLMLSVSLNDEKPIRFNFSSILLDSKDGIAIDFSHLTIILQIEPNEFPNVVFTLSSLKDIEKAIGLVNLKLALEVKEFYRITWRNKRYEPTCGLFGMAAMPNAYSHGMAYIFKDHDYLSAKK